MFILSTNSSILASFRTCSVTFFTSDGAELPKARNGPSLLLEILPFCHTSFPMIGVSLWVLRLTNFAPLLGRRHIRQTSEMTPTASVRCSSSSSSSSSCTVRPLSYRHDPKGRCEGHSRDQFFSRSSAHSSAFMSELFSLTSQPLPSPTRNTTGKRSRSRHDRLPKMMKPSPVPVPVCKMA